MRKAKKEQRQMYRQRPVEERGYTPEQLAEFMQGLKDGGRHHKQGEFWKDWANDQ